MVSALQATVTGRVQMVMYRDFVRRSARALRIVGEVENMSDGSVRVYAEGEEEALNRFVERLKKGSTFSRVDNVAYQFVAPRGGFSDFLILYT